MKILILLFGLTIRVSAQTLKFIPDPNLRNELSKQGFTTNDSLDTKKTQGRLQLELNDKGIENLDGLQYFNQVWRLILYNNKIKNLEHLPPNVTELDCSKNEISRIDSLPEWLSYLGCADNRIDYIGKLPKSLTQFMFANNKMMYLPKLPENIQYVNYSNNPIPVSSMPKLYQTSPCDDIQQNCLPYDLINWDILNVHTKDTTFKIMGLRINFYSDYSWGFGSQVETIDFEFVNSKIARSQTRVIRTKENVETDTSYFNKPVYIFEYNQLKSILDDLISSKMILKIQDNRRTIDLRKLKNGQNSCSVLCADCSSFELEFLIATDRDTIKLNFGFPSDLSEGVTMCSDSPKEPRNIKELLNYLYVLKLVYLTIPDHEIAKNAESRIQQNVDRIFQLTTQ